MREPVTIDNPLYLHKRWYEEGDERTDLDNFTAMSTALNMICYSLQNIYTDINGITNPSQLFLLFLNCVGCWNVSGTNI